MTRHAPTGSGETTTRPVPADPSRTTDLLEAASLARRFGSDPQFSRAGGGNVSAKSDDVLYIKPSGVSLASISAESLMPLALAPLLSMVENAAATPPGSEAVMRSAMAARLRPEGDRRPSVECVFHALIPARFVIHTHPTLVNALTCARDGMSIALDLFGDEALWIPYVDPGLPLAREIARRRQDHTTRTGAAAPDVTLLQNHGLIVAGDDPAAIVERSYGVVEAVRQHLEALPSAPDPLPSAHDPGDVEHLTQVLGAGLATGPQPLAVVFDGSPDAAWLAGTSEGRELVRGGPLTPDQIVYAGSWPLWLDADAEDEARLESGVATAMGERAAMTVEPPIIVVAAGIGVFALGAGRHQAETAREIYLDAIRVGREALRLDGVRPLAPVERRFIEEWEAEAYRRGIEAPHAAEPGSPAR
jgi:rhamnulokinase